MQFIEWNTNYEIGNDHIDFEHKIFLGLIRKLAEDLETNRADERVHRTFAEVVKYAEFHFLSEENLMLDVDYPNYARHKELHEELLQKLVVHFEDFEHRKADLIDIVKFLTEWFVRHTITEDMNIGNFIADKALGR